jgi:plastocyanin
MRHHRTVIAALALTAGALASTAIADTYEVMLDGIDFMYDGNTNMDIDLTIKVGDTVRWIWVGGFHNVVNGFPDDPIQGDLFTSGSPVFPPMTFEYTFVDPGVVGYHCEVHEGVGMFSFVTVLCPADFNGDGTVNSLDFIGFLNAFTAGC